MCSHVNYRHNQHFLFSQTFNTNSTSRNTVQVAHCRWLSVMFGTLDFCVLRENILVNPQSSSARWAGQMLLLLVLLMIKEGTERARGFRQVSQLISPGTELKTLQLLPRASFFPPSHSPVIYPSRIYSVSVLSHLSMCVYTCMCFLAFMCGSCYLYTSPQGPCMCQAQPAQVPPGGIPSWGLSFLVIPVTGLQLISQNPRRGGRQHSYQGQIPRQWARNGRASQQCLSSDNDCFMILYSL